MAKRFLAAGLLALASCAEPLLAQNSPFASERSLENRRREHEGSVRRIEAASPTPTLPTASAESPKPPILAGWDNGFILRSADEQFQLRITGQIQSDYRYYLDASDTTDLPTFLIRRARLGMEANVLKYYEFRLMPDFGNGQTRLLDAYLNFHYWDEVQFEVGKFKQPFSLEQLIQDRFVPPIERSIIDQLDAARDVGLMIHGQKLFDDRIDYGVSVYGGVRDGDQDSDRNLEGAGRFVLRPLHGFDLDLLDGLQIGAAATNGIDRGALLPTTLRTPANVPWFQFADKVRSDGSRTRFSPELAWIFGPATVAAQYYEESQTLLAPAAGNLRAANIDLHTFGFYVMGTLLLTGEQRTSLSQAIDPVNPFDPVDGVFGTGAFELIGRVSQLQLDTATQAEFLRLANPARSAHMATEITAGFNWYLNRFVRVQFNWEYARFSNPVRLGDSAAGRLDHQNSFLSRIQIVF